MEGTPNRWMRRSYFKAVKQFFEVRFKRGGIITNYGNTKKGEERNYPLKMQERGGEKNLIPKK